MILYIFFLWWFLSSLIFYFYSFDVDIVIAIWFLVFLSYFFFYITVEHWGWIFFHLSQSQIFFGWAWTGTLKMTKSTWIRVIGCHFQNCVLLRALLNFLLNDLLCSGFDDLLFWKLIVLIVLFQLDIWVNLIDDVLFKNWFHLVQVNSVFLWLLHGSLVHFVGWKIISIARNIYSWSFLLLLDLGIKCLCFIFWLLLGCWEISSPCIAINLSGLINHFWACRLLSFHQGRIELWSFFTSCRFLWFFMFLFINFFFRLDFSSLTFIVIIFNFLNFFSLDLSWNICLINLYLLFTFFLTFSFLF